MILNSYKQYFATLLAPLAQLEQADVYAMIETPPQADMGDLAFPCFTLAKTLKKAPQVLASEMVSQLEGSLPTQFTKIIAVGPYVNIFINPATYIQDVLGKQNDVGADQTDADRFNDGASRI